MTKVSFEQFEASRQTGPIRIAWYDDEPDNIKPVADQLREEGFEVTVFSEPDDLYQRVRAGFREKEPRAIPDVCITDLLIEEGKYSPDYDGVRVARTLKNQYVTKMRVPARVGIASRWIERIRKAPTGLFCFKYLTSDLSPYREGKFGEFRKKVEQSAVSLWVDHWCVTCISSLKIEGYDDDERFERGPCCLFGYVLKLGSNSANVWLWDPQKIESGRIHMVNIDYLQTHGVKEVQQPFVVIPFIDKKQPSATTKVVKPLSKAGDFRYARIRP